METAEQTDLVMRSLGKRAVARFCLFGGIVLLGLVVAGVVLELTSPIRSVRSPSGRVVRLVEYHFKKGAVRYYRFPHPFLAKILPEAVWKRIPSLRPYASWFESSPFKGEPFLSAHFEWGDVRQFDEGPGTRVVVTDDQGQSYDPIVNDIATSGVFDLDAFPRRGKELRLRLMDGGKNGGQLLAEFRIPNPCPGPHPVWKGRDLPVTATNGALEVTLAKFVVDTPHGRTWCEFRLRENGSESRGWRATAFEVSDATGNHWRPFIDFPKLAADGCVSGGFYGALWPGEDAWKLRVRFAPVKGEFRGGLARSGESVEFLAKPEFVGGDHTPP